MTLGLGALDLGSLELGPLRRGALGLGDFCRGGFALGALGLAPLESTAPWLSALLAVTLRKVGRLGGWASPAGLRELTG